MPAVTRFPLEQRLASLALKRDHGEPAKVVILPVVRIERHTSAPPALPTHGSDEIAKRRPPSPPKRRVHAPSRRFEGDDDEAAEPIGPGNDPAPKR